MRIRLSDDARQFLRDEAKYLKARSSSAAHYFLNRIDEAKINLAQFPHMGVETEASALQNTRRLVIGDYILIYEIIDNIVAVSSIRHGRMMPKKQTAEKDIDYEAPEDAL